MDRSRSKAERALQSCSRMGPLLLSVPLLLPTAAASASISMTTGSVSASQPTRLKQPRSQQVAAREFGDRLKI